MSRIALKLLKERKSKLQSFERYAEKRLNEVEKMAVDVENEQSEYLAEIKQIDKEIQKLNMEEIRDKREIK